jgi:hypothetical protein
MNPADLERLVDASLRALPPPAAPRTLLPRIMASVAALERTPWYARPWLAWPAGWQAASAAVLAAVVVGAGLAAPALELVVGEAAALGLRYVPGDVTGAFAHAFDLAGRLSTAATALRVVWRVVFAPFTAYAAVLLVLMSAACAAFAAAIAHMACRKALTQ